MKGIDWEAAINARKSTRNYDQRPVPEDLMASLREFASQLQVPFEHDVQVRWFKARPNQRLANNLKNPPPDNVAFIANTDLLSLAKAGFVGEMIILYATSLGLGTCWFGHYLLAELERVLPHLGTAPNLPQPTWGFGKGDGAGRRAIAISPLGYPSSQGLRLMDRMTGSIMSHKRKPLGTFLEGEVTEEGLSAELRFALDLARKAPSAANSQFWRFSVSTDCQMVSIAMPVGYKHFKWEHPDVDIGTCACHFWLGLQAQGIDSRVAVSEEEGRTVWRFRLINS
ncbi:MAG: nitroreductase family protein [Bacillota bacterium]|jgi:nitroreductase